MADKALLGKLAESDAQKDAIHVAIAPVTAGETLWPGQRIGVKDGIGMASDEPCGIVDPFLTGAVYEGQRFYIVLFPGSITSLRHDWTHPQFVQELPTLQQVIAGEKGQSYAQAAAIAWITRFADSIDESYEDVIHHAERYINRGEYWIEGGRFEGLSMPDEFWGYYETATGKMAPHEDRGRFFSCSC